MIALSWTIVQRAAIPAVGRCDFQNQDSPEWALRTLFFQNSTSTAKSQTDDKPAGKVAQHAELCISLLAAQPACDTYGRRKFDPSVRRMAGRKG